MDFDHTPRSDEELNPVHASASCHINTLPTELLLNIFSFLPPRDQLEVREVCRRWATVLSVSNPTFSNTITFALDPGTEAYSTLLAAGAAWRRVQITGLVSTTESQDWLRSLTIGSARRLVFRNSVFTRAFLQSSLQRFSQLEELEFINSKMEIAEEGVIDPEAVVVLWKDFLRNRLKSLTVDVGESGVLSNFLKTFTCTGSCLKNLFIRTKYSYPHSNEEERGYIKEVLRNSRFSIRHISFENRSRISTQDFWSLFRWDSPRMKDLRLHTLDLKPRLIRRSTMSKFFTFLQSQSDLTSVSIPPIHASHLEDMAASLPNHLENIRMGCVYALRLPQFIQKLGKVKSMTWYLYNNQIDFNTHLFGLVLPELQSLTVFDSPSPLGFSLVNSFPNLTKLIITCGSERASVDTVNDTELQLIITGLPRLTVLKLSSCARITDFGVTGIGIQMRQLDQDLDTDFDTLFVARKGPALQDLQGLEELSLEGSSQISDVGVQFGFGFKNLRQLNLVTAHKELTAWGLVRLAKLNPKLERMHVETSHHGADELASLEKVLLAELKSSGRWKRLDVSLKVHS